MFLIECLKMFPTINLKQRHYRLKRLKLMFKTCFYRSVSNTFLVFFSLCKRNNLFVLFIYVGIQLFLFYVILNFQCLVADMMAR